MCQMLLILQNSTCHSFLFCLKEIKLYQIWCNHCWQSLYNDFAEYKYVIAALEGQRKDDGRSQCPLPFFTGLFFHFLDFNVACFYHLLSSRMSLIKIIMPLIAGFCLES